MLTEVQLVALRNVIAELPNEFVAYRSQSARQRRRRSRERRVFLDLLLKLAGADPEDQVAILVDQSSKCISEKKLQPQKQRAEIVRPLCRERRFFP